MVIKNEENGLLIPVGDEDALYESLIKIVQNEEYAINLSKEATNVRIRFAEDVIFEQWRNL